VPFRPSHERHAIREVAFVLSFSRDFEPSELETILRAHERWRDELPKANRLSAQQIRITGTGAEVRPVEQPLNGISFEAVKRDGSLEWRFLLQGNRVIVNCLSYTKWESIWPVARGLFCHVPDLLAEENLGIIGCGLQYVNHFLWEGDPGDYKIQALFKIPSYYLPDSVLNVEGPLWHLHQGWFSHEGLVVPGRRLEKVKVDAIRQNEDHLTKVDITMRYDFEGVMKAREAFDRIDAVFDDMHARIKKCLDGFLTEEMTRRISLNA
jgi:uncharacterized protein (TIGR04255 family)